MTILVNRRSQASVPEEVPAVSISNVITKAYELFLKDNSAVAWHGLMASPVSED